MREAIFKEANRLGFTPSANTDWKKWVKETFGNLATRSRSFSSSGQRYLHTLSQSILPMPEDCNAETDEEDLLEDKPLICVFSFETHPPLDALDAFNGLDRAIWSPLGTDSYKAYFISFSNHTPAIGWIDRSELSEPVEEEWNLLQFLSLIEPDHN